MPTSGVTGWELTAREIIRVALVENAIIGPGDTPEADEAAECLVRLNGLLKSWRIGAHLDTTATVTVPANDPSGTLSGIIESITAVRFVHSATNERVMTRWGRDEYMSLPNKAASGTPTIFYEARARDAVTLFVWPVPTVESTLKADYRSMPETVTDLNETVDFPSKYNEALYVNLALKCWRIFNADKPIPADLRADAMRLEREMIDAERPSSYYLWADR